MNSELILHPVTKNIGLNIVPHPLTNPCRLSFRLFWVNGEQVETYQVLWIGLFPCISFSSLLIDGDFVHYFKRYTILKLNFSYKLSDSMGLSVYKGRSVNILDSVESLWGSNSPLVLKIRFPRCTHRIIHYLSWSLIRLFFSWEKVRLFEV